MLEDRVEGLREVNPGGLLFDARHVDAVVDARQFCTHRRGNSTERMASWTQIIPYRLFFLIETVDTIHKTENDGHKATVSCC